MKIPKYIADLLTRSKFVMISPYTNAVPGYTISIEKRTTYSYADTLKDEARRLVEWANREYNKMSKDGEKIAFVDYVPTETHYHSQVAIVTIYDPVMRHIEGMVRQ